MSTIYSVININNLSDAMRKIKSGNSPYYDLDDLFYSNEYADKCTYIESNFTSKSPLGNFLISKHNQYVTPLSLIEFANEVNLNFYVISKEDIDEFRKNEWKDYFPESQLPVNYTYLYIVTY